MKKLILLALLILPTAAMADVFGYDTQGGSNLSTPPTLVCTKFTTTTGGSVTKISTYINHVGADTELVTAIYADNAGAPGSKLAESSASSLVTMDGWVDTTISYSIVATTTYFLCVWQSGANAEYVYDGGDADQLQDSVAGTYPTWPAWSANNNFARKLSIYATYTPAGGGSANRSLLGVGK
jgi:hypothetical protein